MPAVGRSSWAVVVVLAVVGALASPVAADPVPGEGATGAAQATREGLRPCPGMRDVLCGTLARPLDPADPSQGTIDIAFELHPASSGASEGTIVTVEGGPGYASSGSRDWYLGLYEPLLATRDLLIVDNRGTGGSEPINCRRLQSYRGRLPEGGRRLWAPARRHQRSVRHRPGCRRPRRRPRSPRHRAHRPLRRLLRHVLLPDVRRPSPRPAADPHPRRRLPGGGARSLVPGHQPGDRRFLPRRVRA